MGLWEGNVTGEKGKKSGKEEEEEKRQSTRRY